MGGPVKIFFRVPKTLPPHPHALRHRGISLDPGQDDTVAYNRPYHKVHERARKPLIAKDGIGGRKADKTSIGERRHHGKNAAPASRKPNHKRPQKGRDDAAQYGNGGYCRKDGKLPYPIERYSVLKTAYNRTGNSEVDQQSSHHGLGLFCRNSPGGQKIAQGQHEENPDYRLNRASDHLSRSSFPAKAS